MHEPAALKVGLESTIIDIVKYRRPITGLGTKETRIITLGRELMQDRRVSPRVYAETIRAFGITGTVDLVTLMAQYAATAFVLNAFDQQLHSDQRPLLPTRQSGSGARAGGSADATGCHAAVGHPRLRAIGS